MRYFKSRLKGSAVGTIVGSAAAAIGVPIFCLIKWFTSGENLLGLGILFFIGGAIGVVIGVFRYRMIENAFRTTRSPTNSLFPRTISTV